MNVTDAKGALAFLEGRREMAEREAARADTHPAVRAAAVAKAGAYRESADVLRRLLISLNVGVRP